MAEKVAKDFAIVYDVWHKDKDSKWHHYVAIRENGIVKFYSDGEFSSETSDPNVIYQKVA